MVFELNMESEVSPL